MKALIYSTFAPAASQFAELSRAAGVDVLAVVAPRPDLKAGSRITSADQFVRQVPQGIDVCFASDVTRLKDIVNSYRPDIGICVIYPWMISAETIALHPLGVVNAHASLLPALKGPFPVAWAIRNGDTDIGLTLHFMTSEADSGSILAQGARPMPADTSAACMQPIFTELNAELLPVALRRAARGDRGERQSPAASLWAGEFEEAYMQIDWSKPAVEIDRQVRAWEWMPAHKGKKGPLAVIGGTRVRVTKVCLHPPQDGSGLRLNTGEGPLWILSSEPA